MKLDLSYIKPSLRPETELMYLGSNVLERKLQVKELQDAVVVPFQGIFDSTGKHIDESYLHIHHNACKSFTAPSGTTEYIDEAVYIGMFINIWGHCLTDCMKHLWPILTSDERFKTLPLVWVPSRPGIKIFENFWKMLDLLGIPREHIKEIQSPTRVNKLWLPDQCYFTDDNNYQRLCTPEYGQLFEKISSFIESGQEEKIYFTRSALTVHNRDYGEKNVEKVFKRLGYRIYSPEKLTLEQTISLLKGCKSFACTDGSIAHNSLFLPKGTQFTIIRKADTVNSYQSPINQVRDLDVTIIDANWTRFLYNKLAPWDGPFFIYDNAKLRSWSGIRTLFPIGSFIAYLWDFGKVWVKARITR